MKNKKPQRQIENEGKNKLAKVATNDDDLSEIRWNQIKTEDSK